MSDTNKQNDKSEENFESGSVVVICRSSTMCEIHNRMCHHIRPHKECPECDKYCTNIKKENDLDKNCIGI